MLTEDPAVFALLHRAHRGDALQAGLQVLWNEVGACSPSGQPGRATLAARSSATRSASFGRRNAAVACHVGDEAAARAIVAARPGIVEGLGPVDRRALTDEAWTANARAVELMLELGFDPSVPSVTGPRGGNALHSAAWEGSVDDARIEAINESLAGRGFDTEVVVRVDRSRVDAVASAAVGQSATLAVVPADPPGLDTAVFGAQEDRLSRRCRSRWCSRCSNARRLASCSPQRATSDGRAATCRWCSRSPLDSRRRGTRCRCTPRALVARAASHLGGAEAVPATMTAQRSSRRTSTSTPR